MNASTRLSTVLIFSVRKPFGAGSFAFGAGVQQLIADVTLHNKAKRKKRKLLIRESDFSLSHNNIAKILSDCWTMN